MAEHGTWVYDIVRNRNGLIVALNYHPEMGGRNFHENCLLHDLKALHNEGLALDCSDSFTTLSAARVHAWANKDQFAKDLD